MVSYVYTVFKSVAENFDPDNQHTIVREKILPSFANLHYSDTHSCLSVTCRSSYFSFCLVSNSVRFFDSSSRVFSFSRSASRSFWEKKDCKQKLKEWALHFVHSSSSVLSGCISLLLVLENMDIHEGSLAILRGRGRSVLQKRPDIQRKLWRT